MFEWHVRYPMQTPDAHRLAAWAANPESDDLHVVNEVHTWAGANVKLYLRTKDVIHSFYLPNLRLKQDALPGKIIPVWFQATAYNTAFNEKTQKWEDSYAPGEDQQPGTFLDPSKDASQVWELACAELCGWGHFKMRGKLFVHKDEQDYKNWLKAEKAREVATTGH
jgi:cytochrome c oxidase subunit 2